MSERVRIEVRLRKLEQLFNSMDSSPFHERDLDADAEEFIVSWASELPASREIELVIRLTESPSHMRAEVVEEAVRHFFKERAAIKRIEFRRLLQQGRVSLVIGLGFLAVCLTLGEVLGATAPSTFAPIVKEGLIIVGWVAMWRPLEIHLYEWWPLRQQWRLLERLGRISVTLLPTQKEQEEPVFGEGE